MITWTPPSPDSERAAPASLADAFVEQLQRLQALAGCRLSVPLAPECGNRTGAAEIAGYVFFPAALDEGGWC